MSILKKILELNDYLPDSLKSNKNTPVDLLHTILSIQMMMSKISEFADNASHPYYMNETCKDECEVNKYEIFQKWCYPDITVEDLKILEPNLKFSDVIEVSLLFHPIPESINYWDRESLYYYACLNNQPDADDYIKPLMDEFHPQMRLTSVLWIAYKFNRIDVLRTSYDSGYLFGMGVCALLDYKLNGNTDNSLGLITEDYYSHKLKRVSKERAFEAYKEEIFIDVYRNLYKDICRLTNTLLTPEEVIELIVIMYKLSPWEEAIYLGMIYGNAPLDKLNSEGMLSSIQLSIAFAMYAVKLCGFDKADEILAKYDMNKLVYRSSKYESFDIKDVPNPIAVKQLDRLDENSIAKTSEHYVWITHLTSGRILDYLASKPNEMDIPLTKMNLYGLSHTGNSIFNKLLEPEAFSNGWTSEEADIYRKIKDALFE